MSEIDFLKKALNADDKRGQCLIPENFLEGSGFFYNEDGYICNKITKDDFDLWIKIKNEQTS